MLPCPAPPLRATVGTPRPSHAIGPQCDGVVDVGLVLYVVPDSSAPPAVRNPTQVQTPGKWEVFDREHRRSHHVALPPSVVRAFFVCDEDRGVTRDFRYALERKAKEMDMGLPPLEVMQTHGASQDGYLGAIRHITATLGGCVPAPLLRVTHPRAGLCLVFGPWDGGGGV